jgi:hypothetical protein
MVKEDKRSFEEELGISSERLAAACEELENFELGTEAFIKRREDLAEIIVNESIIATGTQYAGESLDVERGLRQSLIELVFVARHSW